MASALHVIITGRVQGVGYRAWAVKTAGALGLRGWVRNRRDGTVEAVFHGDAPKIAAMLAACHNGPATARVDGVASTDWNGEVNKTVFAARETV